MPFLKNKITIFIYALMWTTYALLHALSTSMLVNVSFAALFVDALFHSFLFAGLGVMLWIVLQYGKYERLMQVQRIASYTALGVIFVTLGVGTGYFFAYIALDETEVIELIATLPIKGLAGLMLYIMLVLYFHLSLQHLEIEAEQSRALKTETEPDDAAETEIVERIMVKTKQNIKVIQVTDIAYFRSEGDYVMIIANEGKFLKEQTMKYFESHLPKNLFIRVHRSYIVNIEYISAIESYGKQNQQVLLKNGEWLKVSLAGYKALKTALR